MFEIEVEIPETINHTNEGSYSLSRLVTVQISAVQMFRLAQEVAAKLRLYLTAFGLGMLGFFVGFCACWIAFIH